VLTARDTQITYIGVPLTVAGVIPLLWNMVVAIQIWLRLRVSIPPRLRQYYSLIIDPAAGQVTVVARMPILSSPGQWTTSGSELSKKPLEQESTESISWPTVIVDAARKTTLRPHRRARDHGTTRLASVISTGILSSFGMPFELLMQSMSQADRLGDITGGVKFCVTRSRLLHRPWMSIIEHCKFSMRPPDELDDDQREEVRFTVQSDMKASDFTPLMMTWAHFVWVCLALNVSAYDPLWQSSIPYTIKNGEGKDMIRLFEDNDRLYAKLLSGQEVTYVTHRALAWYNIAFNGEVLFPLGCGTLSQVPISSLNISSELSAPALLQEGAQTLDSAVRGKEPQECDHPLAAACYWMLYRRDLPAGWITVSQDMLEYRQRILCHLKDLDDRNLLLDKLVSIMGPESPQNGALGQDDEKNRSTPANLTARPKPLNILETSKEPHADSINSSSQAEALADVEGDLRAIYMEDPDDAERTRLDKFKTDNATRISIHLRSTFMSSTYVQRFSVLLQIAQTSQTSKSRLKNETKGQATEVSLGDLARWARNFLEPLTEDEYRFMNFGRLRQTDMYELIDPRLRERFEFAVRPYIISPSACDFNWGAGTDEGDFLACVALALSDWDDCAHRYQNWTPQPDLTSLSRKCGFLAHDVADSLPKASKTLHKGIRSRARKLLTNVRKNGLYTAPWSPVHRLMRKNDRNVDLL
jgi:hypothetical protein